MIARVLSSAVITVGGLLLAVMPASAQGQVPGGAAAAPAATVATVDGRLITDDDVRLAEAEIGADLGSLAQATRRRVLVEYLIETQLMADAAERAGLGQPPAVDHRPNYWRRKALRDRFFDTRIRAEVGEAEVRRSFEARNGGGKGGVEIKASHILLATEEAAQEVFEKIGHGADFADMARKYSIDPGSKASGGSLGYIARGQMVPQFEDAAFKLEKGDVSLPVKTQNGWHLIRVEDRRDRRAQDFETARAALTAALMQQKAKSLVDGMRVRAAIVYVDPVMRAEIESERRADGTSGGGR